MDEEGVVTVVIGASPGADTHSSAFWASLGKVLDSLQRKGTSCVRLVMAGAGDERRGSPCAARRIADAWQMDVLAPDGVVLIAPGGTLFVQQDGTGSGRGWWRFVPGQAPSEAGRRAPAPLWQDAIARVLVGTDGGCAVDHIPAGVLMRPADAPAPAAGDLCFAVPMDNEFPTVLIGSAGGADVAADEVAALLAALPAAQRSRARLAPGTSRDLLPLGQQVADMLGSEVEVLTGLPLLPGDATQGTEAVAARPTLMGFDGSPRWQPFVGSVACLPAGSTVTGGAGEVRKGTTVLERPAPRLLTWFPPLPGPGIADQGVVYLDERWQVAVTRAGLAVGERDAPRPPLAESLTDPDTFAIELGSHGEELDPTLWPALSRLMESLDAELCTKASFLVNGAVAQGERKLRGTAEKYRMAGIRYVMPRRGGAPPSRVAPQPTESADHGRLPEGEQPTESADHGRPSEGEQSVEPPAPVKGGPDRVDAIDPGPTALPLVPPPSVPQHASDAVTATLIGHDRISATSSAEVTEPGERSVTPAMATIGETAGPAPRPTGEAAAELRGDGSGQAVPGPGAEPASGAVATVHGAEPTVSERPPSRTADGVSTADMTTARGRGEALQDHDAHTQNPGPPARASHESRSPSRPAADAAIPLRADHVSSQEERTQFRELAAEVWEIHSATVSRVLTRMPALRGAEREAARVDLIAVQAYLTGSEQFVSEQALAEDLLAGGTRLLPYAACLASGLRRLPSFRGVGLRGLRDFGDLPGNTVEALQPGSLLQSPGPVSSLAHAAEWPGEAPLGYAIWSVTGRRIRQFVQGGFGSGADEVVFAPGTAFRVLGTQDVAGSSVVLLRELPVAEIAGAEASPGQHQLDRAALTRLQKALTRSRPARGNWPERCIGPLGLGA
jgi:hypothetical protein